MRSAQHLRSGRGLDARWATAFLVAVLFISACADSDDTSTGGEGSSETSESQAPAAPATLADGGASTSAAPATSTPAAPAPTTAPPAASTTVAGEGDELDCPWPGDPVTYGGFPDYSDGDGFLTAIRLAGQGSFDRFVLEFEGDAGVPTDSYVVSWTATPPEAEGSGLPVAPDGDWYLEVRLTGSMFNFDTEVAYDGPTSLTSDTANVREALSGGSFEGYMLWVLGADAPKGFNVFGLPGPSRLVIDVCTGGPDWG